MKLLNYKLEDWAVRALNHWRIGHTPSRNRRIYIGLICSDSCATPITWEMDCWGTNVANHGIFVQIADAYYSIYNPSRRKYLVGEIEDVKKNIDKLIPKINKLKLFI